MIRGEELADLREKAIETGTEVKKRFKNLTPYRIDKYTVIYVNANRDKTAQANSFLDRLNRDRKRY